MCSSDLYYYSNKEDLVETTFSKILDKISSILQEDMTYQEGVHLLIILSYKTLKLKSISNKL